MYVLTKLIKGDIHYQQPDGSFNKNIDTSVKSSIYKTCKDEEIPFTCKCNMCEIAKGFGFKIIKI